jgi:hypothetical protein
MVWKWVGMSAMKLEHVMVAVWVVELDEGLASAMVHSLAK